MGNGEPSAEETFVGLATAIDRRAHRSADSLVDACSRRWGAEPGFGPLGAAAEVALTQAVARSWEQGWEVADLVHALGRKLAAPDRRLLVRTVAKAGERWRHTASADPAWVRQLDDVEADAGLDAAGNAARPLLAGWLRDERLDPHDGLLRAATLLADLWHVGRLPTAGPTAPPGDALAGVDARVRERIRALLAKAESTEFEAEAEAFDAKAQELMARHSIDAALLAGTTGPGGSEAPATRRVLIHDPYAKGKATLLTQVGRANRCQVVWLPDVGLCTVFGFPTDLGLTDLLYTSLVSQCSRAMLAASRDVARPRAFREAFTIAFASRIGQRLEEATAATVADAVAEQGESLLPVLASRDAEVEAARAAAFPRLRSSSSRVSDAGGWAAGAAAADAATISAAKPLAG